MKKSFNVLILLMLARKVIQGEFYKDFCQVYNQVVWLVQWSINAIQTFWALQCPNDFNSCSNLSRILKIQCKQERLQGW